MGPVTQWRGQPDTSSRRLRWLVLASLLAHAPFTPLVALIGLFGWLASKPPAAPDAPPITAIPVDLIESDEPAAPAPPPPSPVEVTEPPPVVRRPPPRKEPVDAGIPDAGVPDAEPTDAAAETDAGDAGPPRDAGTPNPLAALSGSAKKVIDADANVRVVVYPEKIRNHPLGPRIGKMLASVYQWRDFFGPAKLDPIRDVDRILIVGPELRDSSKVVAILKLNVSGARVHEAIDAIVQADPDHGAWLDAGIPAATAYADRAPRVFALPSPNTVVVVPPSAQDAALKLPKDVGIRKATGPEVVWAYAVTPWRPARLLRIDLPKTLKWAKVWVTPNAGGGATVEAEAEDESPELAEKDAGQIMAVINQNLALADTIGSILGGVLGVQAPKLVEKIELHAEGATIRGTAVLTESQIELVFSQLEPLLTPRRTPRIPVPAAAPTASVTP